MSKHRNRKGISLAPTSATPDNTKQETQQEAPALTEVQQAPAPESTPDLPVAPRILDDLSATNTAQATQEVTKEASKAPNVKPVKGPTKKGWVAEQCRTEQGVTVKQIAVGLDISPVAARSLIGDLRNMGIKVAQANGVYTIRD